MRTARAAAALLVAAACTAGSPPPPARTPGPAPAGTVRVGYPAEPPTLDPLAPAGASAATRDLLRPVLPALFRLDARLRPQPELAERWTVSPDGLAVTLTLRRARWSDGRAIGAEDVRFSFQRLREGPTQNRYRLLEDVEVLGPRRLRLILKRPLRRWWALFSVDDMVLPSHAYSPAWDRGPTVSGGPFAFDGWTPGLSIRLRRNPAWWGRPPALEAIEVLFVPDDETRLQLLARGELDLSVHQGDANVGARAQARGFPPRDGPLDGSPAASGAWAPAYWELAVDTERLAGGRELARALGRALDRHLVTELLDDSGQAADGLPPRFPGPPPQSEGLPALDGPWPARRDLDAVRRELERAGYRRSGEGLVGPGRQRVTVRLAFAEGPLAAEAIARFVHFSARELGIHVEVIPVEAAVFERDWLAGGRADAYLILRRGADAPPADVYRSDAPPRLNPARVGEADQALEEAESSGAVPGRLSTGLDGAWWRRAEGLLAASGGVVPLARVRAWIVSRGGVAGPQAVGSAAGPLWNAEAWALVR